MAKDEAAEAKTTSIALPKLCVRERILRILIGALAMLVEIRHVSMSIKLILALDFVVKHRAARG
jgi:hypothetical protein